MIASNVFKRQKECYHPSLSFISARHTEYDEGYVFSLSVHRGRVPVVQNYAIRCPTDQAGGVPKEHFRCHFRCHFWGGPNFFFWCDFRCHFWWAVPKYIFWSVSLPVPLPLGGGAKFFPPVSLPVPIRVGGSPKKFSAVTSSATSGGHPLSPPTGKKIEKFWIFFGIFLRFWQVFFAGFFFCVVCIFGHDQGGSRAVCLLRSRRRTVLLTDKYRNMTGRERMWIIHVWNLRWLNGTRDSNRPFVRRDASELTTSVYLTY